MNNELPMSQSIIKCLAIDSHRLPLPVPWLIPAAHSESSVEYFMVSPSTLHKSMKKETIAEIIIVVACLLGSTLLALQYNIAGFVCFIVANITSLVLFRWKMLYIMMLAQAVFILIHLGEIIGRIIY